MDTAWPSTVTVTVAAASVRIVTYSSPASIEAVSSFEASTVAG